MKYFLKLFFVATFWCDVSMFASMCDGVLDPTRDNPSRLVRTSFPCDLCVDERITVRYLTVSKPKKKQRHEDGRAEQRRVLIAPSLLASLLVAAQPPFMNELAKVSRAGAHWIHIDIGGEQYSPCPKTIELYTKLFPDLPFDLHMLRNPTQNIKLYKKTGVARMTIPYEEDTPKLYVNITHIKGSQCKSGIAISPETPVECLEPYLSFVDHVTVMGVKPGNSGQDFIPETLRKISQVKELRGALGLNFLIVVDGGVRVENAIHIITAGADVLVAGSSVFVIGKKDYGGTISALSNGAACNVRR